VAATLCSKTGNTACSTVSFIDAGNDYWEIVAGHVGTGPWPNDNDFDT